MSWALHQPSRSLSPPSPAHTSTSAPRSGEALEELARADGRKASAVELHYFGGLGQQDIARLWSMHVNTVARDLRLATAWLQAQLRRGEADAKP
ncbi:MAG: hypothetical protein IT385_20360 [Deltaproteobacteria bacterium]|nr:hypothetical protein [Deltaproteobacteria bacterium]